MDLQNSEDVLLLGDNAHRKRLDAAGLIKSSRNPGLVDTLKLFKNILLGDFKTELIQEQDKDQERRHYKI